MNGNIGFNTDEKPPMYAASAPQPAYNPNYQPQTQAQQPYQYPQQQQQQQPTLNKEQMFAEIINKYEISHDFAGRLQLLNNYKIVFLLDDSSSMNSVLGDSPLNKQGTLLKATRWMEAEYFSSISMEIANLFDRNGTDIYFLNHQPPLRNIRNLAEFHTQFKLIKPNGYTPLTNALLRIFNDNAQLLNERPLLVIVLTDGEPTDERGHSDIWNFKQCLKKRKPIDRIFISIIACTDQDESIEYLNGLDRKVKHLDVVDDFRNERAEVRRSKGPNYGFSYGDYVVKSMIGSIDPSIDKADEHRMKCSLV
jgi:hypothetical protein